MKIWEACLMLQKLKKTFAILVIIVLLPYIVTIFINGKKVEEGKETDSQAALFEDYGISLLAKEVTSDYEEEMIKAQAVLVRTTAYKDFQEQGKKLMSSENFGYVGDIEASWYQKLKKIWQETEGQVLMYGEELALVPFHQVSNGKTRVGVEVLGNESYPYLKMKECPKDVEAENQMESKFIPVKGVQILKTDSAGYVVAVKVGEETISGENFRETYDLASGCFELQEFEDKTWVVTKGQGHGLGMSQHTANEMAKEGKSYKEILQFFFEGTEMKEVAEILWDVE